ncbi:MAG TPA: hypothetical protein VND70_00515 [Acidimicrobiales bacterium]|nr:hypothetical protein [Acidimicrobiales bacterium]
MEAISLGHAGFGTVRLVMLLALIIVNFVAVGKIITKAGFSVRWLVVPLLPLGLWIATWSWLVVDEKTLVIGRNLTASSTGLYDFPVLVTFDYLSVFVTWIFFVVFAFSAWPVTGMQREPKISDVRLRAGAAAGSGAEQRGGADRRMRTDRRTGPDRRTRNDRRTGADRRSPAPGDRSKAVARSAASAQPGPAAAALDPTPATATATATATGPGPADGDASDTIYCSWCGKARAVDAQAIHYCGSRDRPAAFCMMCGTALTEGAADCASCGTAATQLSRP